LIEVPAFGWIVGAPAGDEADKSVGNSPIRVYRCNADLNARIVIVDDRLIIT